MGSVTAEETTAVISDLKEGEVSQEIQAPTEEGPKLEQVQTQTSDEQKTKQNQNVTEEVTTSGEADSLETEVTVSVSGGDSEAKNDPTSKTIEDTTEGNLQKQRFFSDLSENLSNRIYENNYFFWQGNRFDGNIIQCDGFPAHVGTLCKVQISSGTYATAEIIGFNNGQNILSLYESGSQIKVGALRNFRGRVSGFSGHCFLGRVIDALGNPLDEVLPPLSAKWPLKGKESNPHKMPIQAPLDVGVRQ